MRSKKTVFLLAVTIIVLVAPYFIPLDSRRLAVVASVATAVAAVAALLSAIASNAAAQESSEAARQATRALSYAGKPQLELFLKEENGVRYAVIENVSTHPVKHMTLRWSLTGGIEGVARAGDLGGLVLTSNGLSFGTHGPTRQLVLPGFIPGDNARDALEVGYTGAIGPTSWVVRYDFGPGIAVVRGYDNRYYRPKRLISDEEVERGAIMVF